ncbi:MAG: hypothetical protein HY821_26010 [Acidobacteria bacterium]|nr:hypothetical protein [Acidobacteriota bacterium]
MFYPTTKATGRSYTATIALASVAVVFIPACILLSAPVTPATARVAVAASAGFLTMAWGNWRRNSRLTIPTITAPGVE